MLNSILMVIGALIVILIVFVVFSQDDEELDRPLEYTGPSSAPAGENPVPTGPTSAALATPEPPPATADGVPAAPVSTTVIAQTTAANPPASGRRVRSAPSTSGPAAKATPEPGSEEDFQLRLLAEQAPAPITGSDNREAVVAMVQARFAVEELNSEADLVAVLRLIDDVLAPERATFPLTPVLGHNLQRFWLFGFDRQRDEPLFEALVTLQDLVLRMRKAVDREPMLAKVKARIGCGVARGKVWLLRRGVGGGATLAGRPVFMAETLAEAAGDSQIYVDETIHHDAQPFFDFREWKPIKLRPSLPAVAFHELLGLNKIEDIVAFATHEDSARRRMVAVVFRYMKFDDLAPLFGLANDSVEEVALAALETVYELADPRSMGVLKKALHEAASPRLRGAIIRALGALGQQEILPVLLGSTRDSHWQVRYHAVEALDAVMGAESPKQLQQLLTDEDGAVRSSIHRILLQRTGDETHLTALDRLTTDLSVRARRHALKALLKIGSPAALQAACRGIIAQDEAEVRAEFIEQLAEVRAKGLYTAFLTLFANLPESDRPRLVAALLRSAVVAG